MRRQYTLLTLIIIIVLMSTLVACSSSNKTELNLQATLSIQLATESPGPISPEEVYPGPLSTTFPSKEAYPAPTTGEYIFPEIPTPSSDSATVTGILLRVSSSSASTPATTVLLALARVVEDSNGNPTVVSFSQLSAPRALTDNSGRFVFVDVPPGHYALIYDRISDAFLLNDPTTGGDYLFVTEAGQILNLGELEYASFPGKEE